ncbi:MAG: glutamate--tRNA ligase, partial [Chloroflexi bacterium]|nr:glutamate--tRNA ligase [Chloroflexota bacterium]
MQTDRPARVRYAPSPTGDPHVGNIRTAVWAWLHARHTGGQFILRIEDTDQTRKVPGSVERIMESLQWLGLDWDEGPDRGGPFGPYVQSERLSLYREAADRLVAQGDAYPCFCTAEELDALRDRQRAEKRPPGYEGKCRTIPREEAAARTATEPHVVRFAVPDEGTTVAEDLLRGPIAVENSTMDDFVILKSDGYPTYHLAHPVDDHAMEITHVTRGDEWIPSMPRHALLFDALGYERPVFIHTPIILAPGGGKLSKRHGARSMLEYAEDGFLPGAVLNFLCIMGWGYGDETVFRRQRLIEIFEIENLGLNPAVFDVEKLTWLNGVYIREMPVGELAELVAQRLDRDLPADVPRPVDRALVQIVTPLVQERIQTLAEVTPLIDFFWQSDLPVPPAAEFLQRRWADRSSEAAHALGRAASVTEAASPFDAATLEAQLRALADEIDVKAGDLFTLIRLAVTGRRVSPPLFETMEIVG